MPLLPIHFFTIVLNGEPFIRHHIEVFRQLPFRWHWHIVEGVAELNHDSAWCRRLGGQIPDNMHRCGLSSDGTTEYLDELAQSCRENITVYRKPDGAFWDGKLEMVNAPLANVREECLLWQIDSDELWTVDQICTARQMFMDNATKTAAFYWCWFFVGKGLVVGTRNCYSQNPGQEWLRTWLFKPGYGWASHSPPILAKRSYSGEWIDVASENPFTHAETEKNGLVFQHLAYVTPAQLRFKECYYGYKFAFSQWLMLQKQIRFPVKLREYFSWVHDDTMVTTAESCGVTPLEWPVKKSSVKSPLPGAVRKTGQTSPLIIVDGVYFQMGMGGIARVWVSILSQWAMTGFARHILVLDRGGTAPRIDGIRYRTVAPHDYGNVDADRQMLQQVCDEEGGEVFISTYYTTPVSTPSVILIHDMIPETLGADLTNPMWIEKHQAIRYASSLIAISKNTARDIVKFFPDIEQKEISIAHCGVDPRFTPASPAEIESFREKYRIRKPYFLLVGLMGDYKNTDHFFNAFNTLHYQHDFEIVSTGSPAAFDINLQKMMNERHVHVLKGLDDNELRIAYSGAVALVYPSRYEGFGLPILEAMACGCPVITCWNSSLPEAAGDAAYYVSEYDVDELCKALAEIQIANLRKSFIEAGRQHVKNFSWQKMAQTVISDLFKTVGNTKMKSEQCFGNTEVRKE